MAPGVDAGRWAFGYVGYEAAAGLDPDLAVHRSMPLGMPLVWFGICDEPTPVPPLEPVRPGESGTGVTARWRRTWTPEEHTHGVARIRERIAAGDTYQCNHTVRLRLRRDGSLDVDVEALPAPSPGRVVLGVDDEPVDPGEPWLYHKTSLRQPYDGRRARRPDVDDVVMVHTRGEVTETTR